MRARAHDRGTAMLIVVVVIGVAMTMFAAAIGQSTLAVQYQGLQNRQIQVRYAAQAGLYYVCDQIAHPTQAIPTQASAYTGGNNNWLTAVKDASNNWKPLFTNTSTTATPTIVIPGGPNGPSIPVFVWLKWLGTANQDYTLAAYAFWPRPGNSPNVATEEVHLQGELREAVGFSSYMFFTFSDDLYLGASNISGSVQSNKKLYFPPSGTTYVYGNATAHGSIQNSANGVVTGVKASGVNTVTLPANSQVTNLNSAAASTTIPGGTSWPAAVTNSTNFFNIQAGGTGGNFWQSIGTTGTNNVDITLHNDHSPPDMDITAKNSGSGSSKSVTGVPIPTGVLYTDGNITIRSADGTFSGQLTVVAGGKGNGGASNSGPGGITQYSIGNIVIDSPIQYKDSSGNLAFQFTDTSNNPVTPNPAHNWGPTGDNLLYQPNPAYTGNIALGLLAFADVRTSENASSGTNNNLVLNVNTYAQKGSSLDAVALNIPAADITGSGWHQPLYGTAGTGTTLNNLVVSGSLVGTNRQKRDYQVWNGTGYTMRGYGGGGLYAFGSGNPNASPPPSWLANQTPAFGTVHVVDLNAVPAIYYKTHSGTVYNNWGGP